MSGDPDPRRICNSIVERQNLTIRSVLTPNTESRLAYRGSTFSLKGDNIKGFVAKKKKGCRRFHRTAPKDQSI